MSWLYYIFILHQTTTNLNMLLRMLLLYYIFILHQTTTDDARQPLLSCCIISSFYIKPQPEDGGFCKNMVVLYLHSTSNHNPQPSPHQIHQLYYIFILHQTTTTRRLISQNLRLYYIFILHQTTTLKFDTRYTVKLYYIFILHQTTTRFVIQQKKERVVLYLHSTSNHNPSCRWSWWAKVVLYLHSTSNHNPMKDLQMLVIVVLYLHSTSNHNAQKELDLAKRLYYIFILHQTTT